MKYFIFLPACLLLHSFLLSQPLIEVKAEVDAKGDYQFTCLSRGFTNFILEVDFSSIQNLRADCQLPYTGVIRPGTNALFKLKKESASQSTGFRYTTRYIKGCLNPKVDLDYSYLLPVAPGKQTKTSELVYFLKQFADEPEPKDWYAISLKMNAGDTVFASRRGTVCEVKDDEQLKEAGYTMASKDNFLEIYHDDCSFGRYQVFKAYQIFVKPGQFVEAGEPLGIVGGEKYVSGPHVRFCVYYNLGKDPFADLGKASYASRHLAYVPIQFWSKDVGKTKLTNNSTYISDHPADIVTKEMNKRELKKWAAKHNH